MTFEVEFTNRYYDGADFTVTPSDDEFPYYCTIRPAFQYDELSDQEAARKGGRRGRFHDRFLCDDRCLRI